eukprot:5172737-Pyramimonas_sp.AAC.1
MPWAQAELAQHMSYQEYGKDGYIYHMGDPGTKFYLVFHGKVAMYQPEKLYGTRAGKQLLEKKSRKNLRFFALDKVSKSTDASFGPVEKPIVHLRSSPRVQCQHMRCRNRVAHTRPAT